MEASRNSWKGKCECGSIVVSCGIHDGETQRESDACARWRMWRTPTCGARCDCELLRRRRQLRAPAMCGRRARTHARLRSARASLQPRDATGIA